MSIPNHPFDRAAVIENLGGDEELFRQIAAMFVADWPETQARLRRALQAGDAEVLRTAAHSVKGAVMNFAAEPAALAARTLEMACKAGDLTQAPAQVEALIQAIDEVAAALVREIGA